MNGKEENREIIKISEGKLDVRTNGLSLNPETVDIKLPENEQTQIKE